MTVLTLIRIRWPCLQSVCVLSLHVPFDCFFFLTFIYLFIYCLILAYSSSLCSFMLQWHVCSELTWPDVGVKLCAVSKSKCASLCAVLFSPETSFGGIPPFFYVLALYCQLSLTRPFLFASFPCFDPARCALQGRLQIQHELSSGVHIWPKKKVAMEKSLIQCWRFTTWWRLTRVLTLIRRPFKLSEVRINAECIQSSL